MASSSVSQEDVENDYEKLEKRSRIRTARARQINPQVCEIFRNRWTMNDLIYELLMMHSNLGVSC